VWGKKKKYAYFRAGGKNVPPNMKKNSPRKLNGEGTAQTLKGDLEGESPRKKKNPSPVTALTFFSRKRG